jgi:DUF1365 family protein
MPPAASEVGGMKSCIYEGWVRHRRSSPVEHHFRYSMFQLYLDLSELDDVFRGRWFWSTRRFAPAWFRRADHLGDPAESLDSAVRRLVEQATGVAPAGPIRLLTHLRYFGYCMNPVSFYYCFDEADSRVDCIVAEVHNTPWGERHCYVLSERDNQADGPAKLFPFRKQFHVSPFMAMDLDYQWRFTEPGRTLSVHMESFRHAARLFDATLTLDRRPISGAGLARLLVAYPLMSFKVIGAIYWQALKLWWKRCPFHPHPRHGAAPEGTSS